MTGTNPTTTMPPCPDWCQIEAPFHHEDFDGHDPQDGLPVRWHSIDLTDVTASTDSLLPNMTDHPYLYVSITRNDKLVGNQLVAGEVRVALVAEGLPHFTLSELDRVISTLQDARSRANKISKP